MTKSEEKIWTKWCFVLSLYKISRNRNVLVLTWIIDMGLLGFLRQLG